MRRQALGAALVKFGAVLFSYAANYTLIALMTQAAFGRFSLLMAFASIATMAVALGHPQIILRSVAAASTTGDAAGIARVWRLSHLWVFGTSGLFLAAVGGFFLSSGGGASARQLFWIALILPSWALLKLHASVLHGANMTTLGQGAETVLRPAFFLASMLIVGLWMGGQMSAANALALNFLAFTAAFAVTALVNLRSGTLRLVRRPGEVAGRNLGWFRASASLSLISAAQLLILNVDTLMIGKMLSDKDVALYRVAILLSMLVGSVNEVVNVAIRPKIAATYANGTLTELLPAIRRLAMIAAIFCAIALIVFALIGQFVLKHAFGQEYLASYVPTLILIAGQTISSFLGPVGLFLNMTRHERAHFKIIACVLVANIMLNVVLIPPLGNIGAAVSALVTIIVWRLGAAYRFETITGIKYLSVRWK